MAGYFSNSGSFRKAKPAEEVDPMSSMSNIGDVMLVFACGLMVALVVAWNVDLAQFQEIDTSKELAKDDVERLTEQLYGEGNAFEEKGKVYQDPTTGKYYLVEEEDASSTGGSGQ
ncbi:MAG TPA: hypothetical protein DCP91_12755 [Eggerthellaceae bacterium]|nr:hypothetical protein [Eggerthellaceae bacterium]